MEDVFLAVFFLLIFDQIFSFLFHAVVWFLIKPLFFVEALIERFFSSGIMASAKVMEPETRGFSFENYARNQNLMKNGVKPPKVMKTGTTTTAVMFKDGVVLGADTRATGGNVVMNKNCSKIHYLAKNMYCLGAGTAADTEYSTRLMAGNLWKKSYLGQDFFLFGLK